MTCTLLSLCAFLHFWVWDLTVMPPGFRHPEFALHSSDKLTTDQLHLWVEKDLGAYAPSPSTLDYLRLRLTIAVETEREIFGQQPVSPSGDRDIHVLIAALPPYEKNGKKFGFDGFFNVFDQMTETQAQTHGQHSNERNIVYLNALHDLNDLYMHGVAVHELNHLLTHGQYDEEKNPLDPWLNEMLGEAAMQLTGYYTDLNHVERYRAHPEWPIAVNGYGLSYGAVSLFAEYLALRFGKTPLGKIAPAVGNGFERLEAVYGVSWNELFADYAQWLFEQDPPSQFNGELVATHELSPTLLIGPTAITFIAGEVREAEKEFEITAVPPACGSSRNVIRSSFVSHAKNKQHTATALWIESTPPCAAERGQGDEKNSFRLTRKNAQR